MCGCGCGCGCVGVGVPERARQQKELRVLEESLKVERARQEQLRRAQEAELLTHQELCEQVSSHFTCCTGTKVQILTHC